LRVTKDLIIVKVTAIALNTFREAVRNKILYSVILFAIILVAGATIFGQVTIGDTAKVIKDFGLFSISFFGAVITIICGVTLLGKEIKQKTVYNIISKPVARWEFILGKFFGLFLTVATLVALMGGAFFLYLLIYEGKPDWLIIVGTYYSIIEVFILSAVAIFFSTIAVTVTLTGLFTLGAWIAGRSISQVKEFLTVEGGSGPLAWITGLLELVVPDLQVINVADGLVHGTHPGMTHILQATC